MYTYGSGGDSNARSVYSPPTQPFHTMRTFITHARTCTKAVIQYTILSLSVYKHINNIMNNLKCHTTNFSIWLAHSNNNAAYVYCMCGLHTVYTRSPNKMTWRTVSSTIILCMKRCIIDAVNRTALLYKVCGVGFIGFRRWGVGRSSITYIICLSAEHVPQRW